MAELALFLAGAALLIGAVRWWRGAPALLPALLLVGLVLAFFARPLLWGELQVPTDIAYETLPWKEAVARVVVPRNRALWDTLLEQVPFHSLARRRLLALEAPLWSHEMGTGQPLLGDAQSAPFAPLHLLALPLAPLRALTVSAAWELLLQLLLAHALALALGAGRPGAILAAVAWGLSTHAVIWAYDTPGMTSAWVPGVLLGLLALARRERRAAAGLVGCAAGMAASGHPETLAHAAVAAVVVAAAIARGLRMPWREVGRYAGRLAAAAALAGALAAPVLLPFVEALPRSERSEMVRASPDYMQPPPFEALALAALVDPLRFGSSRDDNWDGPESFPATASAYAGLVTLALALAGAAVWRGRILAIVLGGLAALLVAMRVPPFFHLFTALPGMGQAANERLRLFWLLAVALAAGLTLGRLDEAAAPDAEAAGRARKTAAALAAAAALLLGLLPPPAPPVPWQRAWWLLALAVTGGTAALLLAARPAVWARTKLRAPGEGASLMAWAPWAITAGVVLELFTLEVRYHPVMPRDVDLTPPPALRYLADRTRAASAPFRVIAHGYDLLPNLGAVFGLWDPRGNDPLRPAEPFGLLRRRFAPRKEMVQIVLMKTRRLDQGLLDFLGVRLALAEHGHRLPPPWRPVFDGPGGQVWENPEALPIFFLPHHFHWAASAAEAAGTAADEDDFKARGIGLRAAPAAPGEGWPQQGDVPLIRARSNGFDLAVVSPTGGVVASSVSYDPAWRVRVDDRPARALDVDGGFLGFAVAAGSHRVRLDYRPRGWPLGLALCGLGVAVAAMQGFRTRARRG